MKKFSSPNPRHSSTRQQAAQPPAEPCAAAASRAAPRPRRTTASTSKTAAQAQTAAAPAAPPPPNVKAASAAAYAGRSNAHDASTPTGHRSSSSKKPVAPPQRPTTRHSFFGALRARTFAVVPAQEDRQPAADTALSKCSMRGTEIYRQDKSQPNRAPGKTNKAHRSVTNSREKNRSSAAAAAAAAAIDSSGGRTQQRSLGEDAKQQTNGFIFRRTSGFGRRASRRGDSYARTQRPTGVGPPNTGFSEPRRTSPDDTCEDANMHVLEITFEELDNSGNDASARPWLATSNPSAEPSSGHPPVSCHEMSSVSSSNISSMQLPRSPRLQPDEPGGSHLEAGGLSSGSRPGNLDALLPDYCAQKPVHSFWSSDSEEDEGTSGEGSAGFDELQSASDVTLPSPVSPLDNRANCETQIERNLGESCKGSVINHLSLGGESIRVDEANLPAGTQPPAVRLAASATPIDKAAEVVVNRDPVYALLQQTELHTSNVLGVTVVDENTGWPAETDSVLSGISGAGASKREIRAAQKREHKSFGLSRTSQPSPKSKIAEDVPPTTISELDKSGPRSRSLSRRRVKVKKAYHNDRPMPSEPCSEPCSVKSRSRSIRRISHHRLADRDPHFAAYSDDDSSQSSLVALAYASDLLTVDDDDDIRSSSKSDRGGSTGEAMWVTGRAASFDFPALTAK